MCVLVVSAGIGVEDTNQRIVGIVARLRNQDNWYGAAVVALQAYRSRSGYLRSFWVIKISRRPCVSPSVCVIDTSIHEDSKYLGHVPWWSFRGQGVPLSRAEWSLETNLRREGCVHEVMGLKSSLKVITGINLTVIFLYCPAGNGSFGRL